MNTKKFAFKSASAKIPPINDNNPPVGAIGDATPQQFKKNRNKCKKLYRCCASLAKSDDILVAFDEAIHSIGLAGQRRNRKLILLATVSRLFERPVSIVVKGESSGGKNTLVNAVLKFFPKEGHFEMTGMSEKALQYFAHPLKHRMLVITEAAGLQGKDGSVFLRNLLSEGYLRYWTTRGNKAVEIVVEGPTGALITTTKIELYHDDETRLFSVNLEESPKQLRRVFQAVAQEESSGIRGLREPGPEWHALMRWIEMRPRDVVNPYADCIMALTSDIAPPRMVRDVKAMFSLTRAHALLHQKTRAKNDKGEIIATLADYKAVRRLVGDIIAEGMDAAVPPNVRRTVEVAGRLLKQSSHISGGQLVDELQVDKANVSRPVGIAIQRGYLVNQNEGRGKTAQYILGEAMPKDKEVLPTVKAVAKAYRALKEAGSKQDKKGKRPK